LLYCEWPAIRREIVDLRFVARLSQAAIAERLGLTADEFLQELAAALREVAARGADREDRAA
jgi:DNA-directed RNA polymerase specialized sigma24 family protein